MLQPRRASASLRPYAGFVLGVLMFAGTASPARAGWIQSVGQSFANFDQWRLDHTPAEFTGPRPGREFTMLAVHNNTNRPIWFAASWMPWQNPWDNSSKLSYAADGQWTRQAWFKVNPGQVFHYGNTTNGIYYVHAFQEGTNRVWGGNAFFNFPNANSPLGCREYRFVFMPLESTVRLDQ